MSAKSKQFIIIAVGVSFICTVGIMLLMSDLDKDAPKQATYAKGAAYQSKIVPINKTRQTEAKPMLAVTIPKKSTENPASAVKVNTPHQKPLIVKQQPETALIQPKHQPIKKAVTALKLEETTSIAPRKKLRQMASEVTTNKITTLKLKKSTVVESIHNAWAIQLGSFGNATNAINLKDKLKKAGFASFVEAAQINNKKIMRVYVGPETALRDAKKILAKLKKEHNMKGIIVGY